MGGFITLWLDAFGGEHEADWEAYQPEGAVVGYGAWEQIAKMKRLSPALKLVSIRDTRKPLLDRIPESVADIQCDFIRDLRKINTTDLSSLTILPHGLDEEWSDYDRALDWESRWAKRVIDRGEKPYGYHVSVGFDFNALSGTQKAETRSHWALLHLVGRHAYVGIVYHDNKRLNFEDTVYACLNWEGFPLAKWWASEGGFDFWAAYPGDSWSAEEKESLGEPGWQAAELNANLVAMTMVSVAKRLHSLGVPEYTWYGYAFQNAEQWRNFTATRTMLTYWRQNAPNMAPQDTNPPDTNGGEELATLDEIAEKFLRIQRTLNEGKKAPSYTVQGALMDEVFAVAGDGYNLVQELKKVQSP